MVRKKAERISIWKIEIKKINRVQATGILRYYDVFIKFIVIGTDYGNKIAFPSVKGQKRWFSQVWFGETARPGIESLILKCFDEEVQK